MRIKSYANGGKMFQMLSCHGSDVQLSMYKGSYQGPSESKWPAVAESDMSLRKDGSLIFLKGIRQAEKQMDDTITCTVCGLCGHMKHNSPTSWGFESAVAIQKFANSKLYYYSL